jgi:hypothetical protein
MSAATTPVAGVNHARPSAKTSQPSTPSARKARTSKSPSPNPVPNSDPMAPTSVASGCGVGANGTS